MKAGLAWAILALILWTHKIHAVKEISDMLDAVVETHPSDEYINIQKIFAQHSEKQQKEWMKTPLAQDIKKQFQLYQKKDLSVKEFMEQIKVLCTALGFSMEPFVNIISWEENKDEDEENDDFIQRIVAPIRKNSPTERNSFITCREGSFAPSNTGPFPTHSRTGPFQGFRHSESLPHSSHEHIPNAELERAGYNSVSIQDSYSFRKNHISSRWSDFSSKDFYDKTGNLVLTKDFLFIEEADKGRLKGVSNRHFYKTFGLEKFQQLCSCCFPKTLKKIASSPLISYTEQENQKDFQDTATLGGLHHLSVMDPFEAIRLSLDRFPGAAFFSQEEVSLKNILRDCFDFCPHAFDEVSPIEAIEDLVRQVQKMTAEDCPKDVFFGLLDFTIGTILDRWKGFLRKNKREADVYLAQRIVKKFLSKKISSEDVSEALRGSLYQSVGQETFSFQKETIKKNQSPISTQTSPSKLVDWIHKEDEERPTAPVSQTFPKGSSFPEKSVASSPLSLQSSSLQSPSLSLPKKKLFPDPFKEIQKILKRHGESAFLDKLNISQTEMMDASETLWVNPEKILWDCLIDCFQPCLFFPNNLSAVFVEALERCTLEKELLFTLDRIIEGMLNEWKPILKFNKKKRDLLSAKRIVTILQKKNVSFDTVIEYLEDRISSLYEILDRMSLKEPLFFVRHNELMCIILGAISEGRLALSKNPHSLESKEDPDAFAFDFFRKNPMCSFVQEQWEHYENKFKNMAVCEKFAYFLDLMAEVPKETDIWKEPIFKVLKEYLVLYTRCSDDAKNIESYFHLEKEKHPEPTEVLEFLNRFFQQSVSLLKEMECQKNPKKPFLQSEIPTAVEWIDQWGWAISEKSFVDFFRQKFSKKDFDKLKQSVLGMEKEIWPTQMTSVEKKKPALLYLSHLHTLARCFVYVNNWEKCCETRWKPVPLSSKFKLEDSLSQSPLEKKSGASRKGSPSPSKSPSKSPRKSPDKNKKIPIPSPQKIMPISKEQIEWNRKSEKLLWGQLWGKFLLFRKDNDCFFDTSVFQEDFDITAGHVIKSKSFHEILKGADLKSGGKSMTPDLINRCGYFSNNLKKLLELVRCNEKEKSFLENGAMELMQKFSYIRRQELLSPLNDRPYWRYKKPCSPIVEAYREVWALQSKWLVPGENLTGTAAFKNSDVESGDSFKFNLKDAMMEDLERSVEKIALDPSSTPKAFIQGNHKESEHVPSSLEEPLEKSLNKIESEEPDVANAFFPKDSKNQDPSYSLDEESILLVMDEEERFSLHSVMKRMVQKRKRAMDELYCQLKKELVINPQFLTDQQQNIYVYLKEMSKSLDFILKQPVVAWSKLLRQENFFYFTDEVLAQYLKKSLNDKEFLLMCQQKNQRLRHSFSEFCSFFLKYYRYCEDQDIPFPNKKTTYDELADRGAPLKKMY